MGIIEIASRIRGGGCKRLVKQADNEIRVTGASFGVGNFKIDVGKFSNKIKEFYKVTQTTIALDNSQFLLCDAISGLKNKPQLQEDCIKMRLQLIYAFSQLQAILGSMTEAPAVELEKELTKWVRKMSKLNENSIEALKPGPRMIPKGIKKEVAGIMKYQGIPEERMQEAVNLVKGK
jgi:hypothetical protein